MTSRRVLIVLLIGLLPISTSCYTYHMYQAGGPNGVELGNQPSTEWKQTTRHAFAWGLIRQDLAVTACREITTDGKIGFEDVKVETSFLYALVTVATLGIWSPLKVSYRCSKPCSCPQILK